MTSEAVEFQGVTPNLMYEDLDVAIDWLTSVCGFRERARYVDEDGVARQAELYAGENEIWISGHGEGLWERQARGPEVYIVVWVDDVDAQWRRVRAAGHDAPDPVDRSFGVRNFYVTDPGGYHWGFHCRLARGYIQEKSLADGGLREILSSDP